MLNRRKFLAGAVAVAVAPMAGNAQPPGMQITFRPENANTGATITLEQIRSLAALMQQHHIPPIMHDGEPCYRLDTVSESRYISLTDLLPPASLSDTGA